MKFLLVAVNAKYIHSNPAVYSLKEYAKKYWEYIEIAEYTINEELGQIRSDIYRRKPDVIGFSCYIWNISYVESLVSDLHKIFPYMPIWLGGPEVSYEPKETLQKMNGAFGVMVGEGEATFLELMEYYVEHDVSLEQINGIVYHKRKLQEKSFLFTQLEQNKDLEDSIVSTSSRTILDLESIPFLYNHLPLWDNKIIYYETSRGCPFRCSYCLSSVDKTVRFRSLDTVKRELDFFLENKVPQVKLVDRTFNARKSHSLAIWKYLLEHDNGVTNFHFEISADLLSEEELQVMSQMRPGLIQLEIGVQTMNQDTLKEIRRYVSFEKLAFIVKRVKSMGNIHQHLDLIAGLPMEDYESFSHSFDDVYGLEPDQLQLGFLKVLKGSYMYERAEEYGLVYTEKPPYEVLYTKWLSYEDIVRLKSVEAVVEDYYNSGQFTTILPWLLQFFERPFEFYEQLGDYYRKCHLDEVSHNRIQRYEILRRFVKDHVFLQYRKKQIFEDKAEVGLEEVLDSLLVYDLYLRENKKNSPDFASQWQADRDWVRNFFESEERDPKYLFGYDGYTWKQMMKMTHMEQFQFDIEDTKKKLLPKRKKHIVIFDYINRNPLTKNAKTIILGEK